MCRDILTLRTSDANEGVSATIAAILETTQLNLDFWDNQSPMIFQLRPTTIPRSSSFVFVCLAIFIYNIIPRPAPGTKFLVSLQAQVIIGVSKKNGRSGKNLSFTYVAETSPRQLQFSWSFRIMLKCYLLSTN